ncbi:hypothetical protein [Ruegeria atlantica]|uniref:hypothetical protein n=1 Tax=Ruegeria atlantica TaxID=81569 RepID=UPI00147E4E3F|nr:hypothetical protein [Ruegeria atlantica]
MVRVVSYHGREAVAGLRWDRKPDRPFWKAAPIAASWSDRSALLPDGKDLIGTASLLSLLVGGLPDQMSRGTMLFAFADPTQDFYFAAVNVDGKPSLSEESLFSDRKELLDHLRRECGQGGIDSIATTPELAALFRSDLKDLKEASDLKEVLIGKPPDGYDPVRVEGKRPKQPGYRALAKLVVVTGLAGCAVIGGRHWFTAPEPERDAELMVAVVTDRAAFEQSCLEAFEEEWPRAPGWDVVQEGCATPRMQDPALNGKPVTGAVAYREYQLRGNYDSEIARRAAEAVHEDTDVSLSVENRSLFATKVIQAPVIKAGQGGATVPMAPDPVALRKAAAEVFLGSAGLRVTLPGGSQARVRVELQGSFEDVLSTAGRLPGTRINRLSRQNETVTLELVPIQPHLIPLAAFGKEAI